MNTSTGGNETDRRKILYWVAGALSVLMFWKYTPKAKKKTEMVKMLTEDGRLVEVDMKYVKGERTQLKADEFHSWVKRKKS